MRPSLVASIPLFFWLTVLVTSSLCAQISDSPGSVNCPPSVNLTVTVTTEDGAVIPSALVILREDTAGQRKGVKVFKLELRTDETGKATAAVPCNYLDVFVAANGFAPAAQKLLITNDATRFQFLLKMYPVTRTTEEPISGGVPTVTAELPNAIDLPALDSASPAKDESCGSRKRNVRFRVAYAHYVNYAAGKTLDLRVSIRLSHKVTQELLDDVACSIAAKYPSEKRLQVLVFSDYETAKNYAGAKSREEEPPAYLGACENLSCNPDW